MSEDRSIEAYRKKRDFTKTPEPVPESGPAAGEAKRTTGSGEAVSELREFTVQRHEARRLHYDLRLEMDGVLKSWAVPKGFSYVPEDKHLAVRTEDHPMMYLDFDGVIPKGEYGAGTMQVWDRGQYELVKFTDGPQAIENGELKFRLYGRRLRGEWHMVRTSRSDDEWLLFKHRDRYARSAEDPPFPLDLADYPQADTGPPAEPMLANGQDAPLRDDDWLYELDFAGVRALAVIEGESVTWFGSDGARLGVPDSVNAGMRNIRAQRATLDGVLVVPDAGGRPDGEAAHRRVYGANRVNADEPGGESAVISSAHSRGDASRGDDRSGNGRDNGQGNEAAAPLFYYVFDVLQYDDWDIRSAPQVLRKRTVQSIVPSDGLILSVDHVAGRGAELMAVVQANDLPGIIAKHREAAYESGPSAHWARMAADDVTVDPVAATRAASSRVKVSNRDKVFWSDEGHTKGDLIDYYDAVAPHLLPHLEDRPIHLLRYPDGIHGKSFYHKDTARFLPDWVPTVEVGEKDGDAVLYVMCNDRDTLIALINLGSIDLHPWMSRRQDLDSPDYCVIDLDPGDADQRRLVRVAEVVGRILRGAEMRPLVKTSGKTGIHIWIPLAPGYTYDQSRMFGELVARMTVREVPDLATVERSKGRRGSKVYVDYLQNAREQTVVPPYVVRPVPGATVSTPLDWDELVNDYRPKDYTLTTVPDRLERLGDLFRSALSEGHDLAEVLEKLG